MIERPVADVREMIQRSRRAPVAIMKLLTGPAADVRMSSSNGLRKLRGSTGVGLAHPRTVNPVTAATIGSRIVPIGSMWRIGFSDTRPNMRAVGSPQRDAVQAWADWVTLIAI